MIDTVRLFHNLLLLRCHSEQNSIMVRSDYAELAAFVAVAEERSFRRAAARLGVSASALSHSIRGLEGRLGISLLHRTTRSVAPTDAGSALFERIAPAFSNIADAMDTINAFRNDPAGKIRINLPKVAAKLVFTPVFQEFATRFPGIQLDLTIEDELSDIVASGFDAGIRLGAFLHRDMVAVRVSADLRTAIVGSPAYFKSRTFPATPEDLKDHACINYRYSQSGGMYRWTFAKRNRNIEIVPSGPMTFNDVDLMLDATLSGVGLTCLLEQSVQKHLAEGKLVRVLEDWCKPIPGFYLYYSSHRHTSMALRCIVDFLRDKVSGTE